MEEGWCKEEIGRGREEIRQQMWEERGRLVVG